MTGLTIGRFSESLVKMPPENQYENVAEVLTGLSSENESHTNTEQQLQNQMDHVLKRHITDIAYTA